jgi:hypothetical protein
MALGPPKGCSSLRRGRRPVVPFRHSGRY